MWIFLLFITHSLAEKSPCISNGTYKATDKHVKGRIGHSKTTLYKWLDVKLELWRLSKFLNRFYGCVSLKNMPDSCR